MNNIVQAFLSDTESPALMATVTLTIEPPEHKVIATLQARLALKGWVLTRQASGAGFWATQFGRSRELMDLDAVAQFANDVGAQP